MTRSDIVDKLHAQVKEHGYKMTGPRIQVLEYLVSAGGHPGVQEIYDAVKLKQPGTGIATIYRTMELLTRLGLVRALLRYDNRLHYEINWPEEHHHHLICTQCGRVVEFSNCTFQQMSHDIEKTTRFQIHKHTLEAYGLCPQCS